MTSYDITEQENALSTTLSCHETGHIKEGKNNFLGK